MTADQNRTVLFIEPFYGGSHQQLVDLLAEELPGDLYTLPATKWHWRMRTSALHFSLTVPHNDSYRTLFASSTLNLCELVSLRPDLAKLHKVLYFHENQLVYPVRKQQERDFQYGYNEVLSCLVADKVLFNSSFNMESFLNSIHTFMKLIPDHRPKGLAEIIQKKCSVLYFPLKLEKATMFEVSRSMCSVVMDTCTESTGCEIHTTATMESSVEGGASLSVPELLTDRSEPASCTSAEAQVIAMSPMLHTEIACTAGDALHIVWPHRWEHDKGPEEFCSVVKKLLDAKLVFKLSVLGAHTNDIPDSFSRIFPLLGPHLVHKGPVPKSEYWEILRHADVVVSTSKHEFFGVAMLEAVACGCYPLCPRRLVYPEFYPDECLYNTEQQLLKRLESFCKQPQLARKARILELMSLERFQWENLKENFCYHLNIACKDH